MLRLAAAVLLPYCLCAQSLVDYERQVHPILAAKCWSCHSQEKRSGGLSLATLGDALAGGRSGAAIKPGSAATSLLMRRVNGEVQPRMPVGAPPLSDGEMATLRAWIDEGARATPTSAAARPKWEAPLSLAAPAVAPVVWKDWQAPVDRFVASYLAGRGARAPELVSD